MAPPKSLYLKGTELVALPLPSHIPAKGSILEIFEPK